jgi:hypothetical protein
MTGIIPVTEFNWGLYKMHPKIHYGWGLVEVTQFLGDNVSIEPVALYRFGSFTDDGFQFNIGFVCIFNLYKKFGVSSQFGVFIPKRVIYVSFLFLLDCIALFFEIS